jgi:hypothetical protein
MAIFEKRQKSNGRQKYFARPITLTHDEILPNGFLHVKRRTLEKNPWLEMRIAVSRE